MMRIDFERGQACVEAVAALAVLTLFMLAVNTVGRDQSDGLSRDSHSRKRVFDTTRGVRAGQQEQPDQERMAVVLRRSGVNRPFMQAGGAGAVAKALREQLRVQDRGIWSAHIGNKHTAILAEAGHAAGDRATHDRIARSQTAWRRAAEKSASITLRVNESVAATDRGWPRPVFDADWLEAWTALVPPERAGLSGR